MTSPMFGKLVVVGIADSVSFLDSQDRRPMEGTVSNILFVCTANICRSPAAEAIARSRHASSQHRFASAGFLYEGRPATPEMVKALSAIDVDASGHLSSMLTAERGLEADLVLTMESRHVQDIGVMSNQLFERTIPITEAADRLARRRVTVDEFRSEFSERNPLSYLDSKWDVDDPYKQSRRKYKKAVTQISDLVDAVLTALS